MIVLVTGVSGSGKTTVGGLLAGRLGWAFEDGDVLHPAANIAKMRAGHPLTDADRWPWLRLVGEWMDARVASGLPAVVACSALKRSYRDLLRAGRPWLRLVLLRGDRDLLTSRLAARHGHFFDPHLLASQLADLELPQPDEDVLVVPIAGPPGVIAGEIMRRLNLAPAPGSPANGSPARGDLP
jgi:gluconokinase